MPQEAQHVIVLLSASEFALIVNDTSCSATEPPATAAVNSRPHEHAPSLASRGGGFFSVFCLLCGCFGTVNRIAEPEENQPPMTTQLYVGINTKFEN